MIDQRQSHQRLRNWERHAREKLMKQLSTIDLPTSERLNNLEIDYGEERTARETRTNLGQPMSLPDIDFYDEYNQQRHFLRQGLLKTEAEVEELRRQCVTAGLMSEPNESKAESRTMYPSSDVRSARDGPPRYWYRLPYSEVNTVIKSSMALLSTRARVNEWLNQVLRVTGIELILSQHQPDEPNDMSTSLNTLAEWEEIDESEIFMAYRTSEEGPSATL
ncbi:hypothetical protein K490DRAFT_57162 [Saccharata proteae CBS 121410]|uniref:Uncharacterized protein n=1 Tax=Saccharata proteae CBS 121410 TaxID=1314787 RepID=A0A9P4LV29_9PEZI|nr:hypothetical protein K490DRAFT_57162 [Saccharata proteae CBS 121410]